MTSGGIVDYDETELL